MDNDFIQWPRAKYWDKCWNPIVGCEPVSPACDNCYARTAMVERFGQSFEPHPSKKQTPPRKGVAFCGNMTDLFGEWVERPSDYILKTLGGKATAYLFLTKRARRMADCLCDWVWSPSGERVCYFDFDMSRHYFGVTAENQVLFEKRIGELGEMLPGMNKWLSLEPLLGPIDFYPIIRPNHTIWNIKWVVVGCESGPHRRPCKIEWVESIVEQCCDYGIPVFVKQLDIGGKCVTDIDRFPAHLRIRQVPWAKKEGRQP